MSQKKFPTKVKSKWNRYSFFEKNFIIYCIILFLWFLLPIIKVESLVSSEVNYYYLFSGEFLFTTLLLFLCLFFLLLWNVSYKFKKLINVMLWFKDDNYLLNFIILLMMNLTFVSIWDTVNFLRKYVTTQISFTNYYLFLWFFLVIWLIWNLIMVLKKSKSNNRTKIVNVVDFKNQEKDLDIKEEWEFKSLFDN